MKVLIPLLSKRENNSVFMESIPREAEEITLLLVIDKGLMIGRFGFAASDIATGNEIMQEMRKTLVRKRKKCIDMEAWGDTEGKILQIAQLKQADKIFLVKQDNEYYKGIARNLKQKAGIPIEEIEIPSEEEEAKQKKEMEREERRESKKNGKEKKENEEEESENQDKKENRRVNFNFFSRGKKV